jgi:hypothetical protein
MKKGFSRINKLIWGRYNLYILINICFLIHIYIILGINFKDFEGMSIFSGIMLKKF